MTVNLPNLDGLLPYEERGYLYNIPAVYFVFDDLHLYYIGRSQWLRNRFSSHGYKKLFESMCNLKIGWIEAPEGYRRLIPLELEFIASCKPLWNKCGREAMGTND